MLAPPPHPAESPSSSKAAAPLPPTRHRPARSTSGCHTCRVRKKKCDEARPVCANCVSRNIPCYGYGERPGWMEGLRQRPASGSGNKTRYVEIIKKAAERSYRARRRGWDPNRIGTASVGNGVEKGPEKERSGNGEEIGGGGDEEKASHASQITMMMSGCGNGGLSHEEPDMETHPWIGGMRDDFSTTTSPMDWLPSSSLSFRLRTASPKENDADPNNTSTTLEVASSPLSSNQYHFCFPTSRSYATSQFEPKDHFLALPSPSLSSTSTLVDLFPPHIHPRSIPHTTTLTDLDLLSHYLDRVFVLQYGFSDLKPAASSSSAQFITTTTSSRAWYISMLLKCQPLYFATLSLSSLHRGLVFDESCIPSCPEFDMLNSGGGQAGKLNIETEKNFVMALKGLQGIINDFQDEGLSGLELLKARWQVLGTMCQLLSLEVFRSIGGNWTVHIQAARTFLSMIGSSSFTPSRSLSICRNARFPKRTTTTPPRPPRLDILEQVLNDKSHHILSTNDTAALRHYATSVVWIDMISRASGIRLSSPNTGACVAQELDYLPLLENHTLDLSHVMGCENWVFIGIAQVVMLESTLREQRGHRSTPIGAHLDELDLVSRATVLELMFESGIRDLLVKRKEIVTELELHSSLVTEMFALAALVYLHVTNSGAYPWLPQVRSIVDRALDALTALPPELLVRVSWPFAVTGCMVLEERQSMVREITERAQKIRINIGTVWKGVLVVKECWRLRGEEVGEEISWVHAMESLKEKILLC